MAEQSNHELLKKLVIGEPQQTISNSPPDISIYVPDKAGGEREYIYPIVTSSDIVVLSTSADLGVKLEPIDL